MTISDINVDEALERVRQQLKEDHTAGKTHEKPLYNGLRSALPVGARENA